jgi:hypothetical protein
MVESLARLNRVALGFDPATCWRCGSSCRSRAVPARLEFFDRLEQRVAQYPGIEAVAYANNLPLRGGWSGGFVIEGESPPAAGHLQADFQAVSAGYFRALDITLSRGRLLTGSDRTGAPAAAVVNRLFETRFLRGANAIGRQIRRTPTAPPITIVGVVDDVRGTGERAN